MPQPSPFTAQLRTANPSIASVVEALKTAYAPPEAEKDTLKARMYDEILSRCAHDIAGNLQKDQQDAAPILKMNEIYDKLTREEGHKRAFELILKNITAYNKVFVQTPHPTETLSHGAIYAEEALMQALEGAGAKLFEGGNLASLSSSHRAQIAAALKDLYTNLKPVEESLEISDEMNRSVVFSQRIYDAIPLVASSILQATNKKSRDLSNQELDHFSHLIRADTWSPGDRDSKPDMTAQQMEDGIRLNRRAMFRHYFRDLMQLGCLVQEALAQEDSSVRENVNNHIYTMMERLLETSRIYEEEKKQKLAQDPVEYAHDIIKYMQQEYGRYQDTRFWEGFVAYVNHSHEKPAPFTSTDTPGSEFHEFREELLKLRDYKPLQKISLAINGHDEADNLNILDRLIIQVGNFGYTALKSQVRQNARVHERTCERLQEYLAAAGERFDLSKPNEIDRYLERLKSDTAFRAKVHEIIAHQCEELAQDPAMRTPKLLKENILSPEELKKPEVAAEVEHQKTSFFFYQTLKGMQVAAENPDAYPRYLIAECENATHMMQALALLKSVEPENKQARIEIVPLVEAPEFVMEKDGHIAYVDMMKEVLQNKHFRAHHDAVSARNYSQLLKDHTVEGGQVVERNLSTNDVRRQYHLQEREDVPISCAKLCMGAGSDVTKAGGIAAAAVMQHAMQKLREELLTLEKPVLLIDYLGCGGGVHRTQPVSNSVETVQGRSLRQSAGNIAKKALNLLTRFLGDRFKSDAREEEYQPSMATSLSKQTRKALAQINLGNMAGLAPNEGSWKHITSDMCNEAIERYENLYHSKEFKALLSYSANIFGSATSYAARPLARKDSEDKKETNAPTFPPEVDIKKLRAIGYGTALNVAGSCGSLYYGLGTLAEKDPQAVRQAYLYDPLMQDAINRATYGVVMADMDTAWKYLDMPDKPDEKMLKLFAESNPTDDDGLGLAKKALAKITIEHQKLLEVLVPLHHELSHGARFRSTGVQATQEQLLADLPAVLRSQMSASRKHIKPAREALADLFQKYLHEEATPPDLSTKEKAVEFRKNDDFKQLIYPAMVTLMEAFEHPPRGYTRPYWALTQETNRDFGRS